MYVVFAFSPFLIVAPVVVIAGLIVWAIPVAIIIVFGGICLVIFKASRLVKLSARKLRRAQKAAPEHACGRKGDDMTAPKPIRSPDALDANQ